MVKITWSFKVVAMKYVAQLQPIKGQCVVHYFQFSGSNFKVMYKSFEVFALSAPFWVPKVKLVWVVRCFCCVRSVASCLFDGYTSYLAQIWPSECHMVSWNFLNIGSDNGLLVAWWHQAITCATVDCHQWGPLAISLEVLKISIFILSLKITHLMCGDRMFSYNTQFLYFLSMALSIVLMDLSKSTLSASNPLMR